MPFICRRTDHELHAAELVRLAIPLALAFAFAFATLTGCKARTPGSHADSATGEPVRFSPLRVAGAESPPRRDTVRRDATRHDSLGVTVFVYHSVAKHDADETGEQRMLDVDTTVFRAEMDMLRRRHCSVVSLSSVVDALRAHTPLPGGAVVLTFDDGWKDQYEEAFPILKQYGYTATFFIYTHAIDNGPAFMSWDAVRDLQHSGMTIGAHSRTHPEMTRPGVSLANEIDSARSDLAHETGVAPRLFAYPYGVWNARVAAAVRAAGFDAARGMADGDVRPRSDLNALPAVLATDDTAAFARELDCGS
jgi:peptidoglycan/xylan/chitin deacetylase (PgdA/CDA1 family)